MIRTTWRRGVVTLAVSAAIGMVSVGSYAADGGIVGSVEGIQAAGHVITIKNTETGLTREVVVDAGGDFRFPQLPVGEYEIVVTKDGSIVGRQTVRVALAGNAVARFDFSARADANVIEVIGARPSAVDLSSTDSGLVVTAEEIDALPVGRNLTAVALLAPGTVQGDGTFGNLASFGGSSVAENACFINGVEVTDTRQGLGCAGVPFSSYREFQIKTGGYSSYYGRSTGGIINAVTKSGTNEWEFDASIYATPESLRSDGNKSIGSDGHTFVDTSHDSTDFWEANFSAAGPIIQDRLFIYALVNPRWSETEFATGGRTDRFARPQDRWGTQSSEGSDNLFWMSKVDWDISDNHRLEYFTFSDRRDTESILYDYDVETHDIGAAQSTNTLLRGSEVQALTYIGHLTEDLTVKAMRATVETEFNNILGNTSCPSITDSRNVPNPIVGCGPGGGMGTNADENTQTRLDIEWAVGDHVLRVGADLQDRDSVNITTPIGGGTYVYQTVQNGGGAEFGIDYTNDTGGPVDVVSRRVFVGGGSFSSTSDALYIEDQWQITPDLLLSVGVRSDDFENKGTTGVTFAKFDSQIAPRLGVAWDPTGDGTSKVFANWGRYYLGIPNNTNYRVASGIADATSYYYFTGFNPADGTPTGLTPVNGTEASSTVTNSVPAFPEVRSFQSEEADAFYKDEILLGYQFEINDEYSALIRGVYRDTPAAVDDYCGSNTDWCTLIAPGEDNTWWRDEDFDGVADPGSRRTYTAEELGLPKAHNEYHAVQFELQHRSAKLRWDFSYTWSRSFGNFEGAVKSDIGQRDAGITQDFDFAALMDGADGYLPNHREHQFKFYGKYSLTDNLDLSWNTYLASGKPYNAFGRSYGGNLLREGSYGDYFWSCPDSNNNGTCEQSEYVRVARGDAGNLPWQFNMDIGLDYGFNLAGLDMSASVEIFNLLDNQETTEVVEHAETSQGVANRWYRTPYAFQAARSIRLGLIARF